MARPHSATGPSSASCETEASEIGRTIATLQTQRDEARAHVLLLRGALLSCLDMMVPMERADRFQFLQSVLTMTADVTGTEE